MAKATSETAAKVNLDTIRKLLAAAGELTEKLAAIVKEADEVLGGKASLGVQMKEIEQAFDDVWCLRYAKGMTGRYVWNYTVDRPQMKRLLKSMSVEEIILRMARYLRTEDRFFLSNRHPFGLFVRGVNQFAGAADAAPDLELSAAPADCRHVPPCASDQAHTKRKLAEMRA